MSRYLLDTNVISHILRRSPFIIDRLTRLPIEKLMISSITLAEIQFGLAKRPGATKLRIGVEEILKRVDIVPFGKDEAKHYGLLRAALGKAGLGLAPFDALIAAHARAADAVLVSGDKAFDKLHGLIPGFIIENWSQTERWRRT